VAGRQHRVFKTVLLCIGWWIKKNLLMSKRTVYMWRKSVVFLHFLSYHNVSCSPLVTRKF